MYEWLKFRRKRSFLNVFVAEREMYDILDVSDKVGWEKDFLLDEYLNLFGNSRKAFYFNNVVANVLTGMMDTRWSQSDYIWNVAQWFNIYRRAEKHHNSSGI